MDLIKQINIMNQDKVSRNSQQAIKITEKRIMIWSQKAKQAPSVNSQKKNRII